MECGGRASPRAATPLWLPGMVNRWSAVAERVRERRRHRFGLREWGIYGVRWQSESASGDTALASGNWDYMECGDRASLRAAAPPLWASGMGDIWGAGA